MLLFSLCTLGKQMKSHFQPHLNVKTQRKTSLIYRTISNFTAQNIEKHLSASKNKQCSENIDYHEQKLLFCTLETVIPHFMLTCVIQWWLFKKDGSNRGKELNKNGE